jgi:hypothetical protein
MEYDTEVVAELLEGNHDDVNANRLENMIATFEALSIERDYDELTERNTASLVRADDLDDISRAVNDAPLLADVEEEDEDDDAEDDAEAEESDSQQAEEEQADDDADPEDEEETSEEADEADEEADSEEADSADASGFPREAIRQRLEDRTAEYDGGYDEDEHEKKDLYTLAQEFDVSGRSSMNKQELIEGILDAKQAEFEADEGADEAAA